MKRKDRVDFDRFDTIEEQNEHLTDHDLGLD